MSKKIFVVLAIVGVLSLAACTNMNKTQQGALTGAAGGAAAGAGIAAISGGNVGVGAALGGTLGGVAGGIYGRNQQQQHDQNMRR